MLREPLEAVIRKCMEPDMELRYQTAAETGKALGQLLAAESEDWKIRLGAHVDFAFGFGKKFRVQNNLIS